MIHASAETVVIVVPAAMETVEIVKKVGAGATVDTIAEAVEIELTDETDIKEEIEGKMEIEESDVKVVSIDEKIAEEVAEKVDDSTVLEIKREA